MMMMTISKKREVGGKGGKLISGRNKVGGNFSSENETKNFWVESAGRYGVIG